MKLKDGLIITKEAIRILKRRVNVGIKGYKKYHGDSARICEQIIEDCWHREGYFKVSNGHFSEFYTRDFGWVANSLIKLGYKKKVISTIKYALNKFREAGRITTSINPAGKPFDFPSYAPDSLAYLLKVLTDLNEKEIIENYKDFLNKEILKFYTIAIDKKTGLIRPDKKFSSMKDHSHRHSSCYDNSMAYLIQNCAKKLNLKNPLEKYNYKKLLIKFFWTGDFFLDDLSGKQYIAGDANVFPFWTKAITSKEMLARAVKSIRKLELDKPIPLRYTSATNKDVTFRWFSIFVPDYERSVVWTHMGPLYIELVGKIDRDLQKEYINLYSQIIKNNKNYFEVLDNQAKPFKNIVYASDESMIWCANYLWLYKNILRNSKRR